METLTDFPSEEVPGLTKNLTAAQAAIRGLKVKPVRTRSVVISPEQWGAAHACGPLRGQLNSIVHGKEENRLVVIDVIDHIRDGVLTRRVGRLCLHEYFDWLVFHEELVTLDGKRPFVSAGDRVIPVVDIRAIRRYTPPPK